MNRKREAGFTIVELLIVIVVIGILAAITIVSYTGITTRANTAKAQTNAVAVQKVAEAYYADNNAYPTAVADFTAAGNAATLPTGITFLAGTTALDATNGDDSVIYAEDSPDGAIVQYWDFDAGAAVTITLGSPSTTTRVPAS